MKISQSKYTDFSWKVNEHGRYLECLSIFAEMSVWSLEYKHQKLWPGHAVLSSFVFQKGSNLAGIYKCIFMKEKFLIGNLISHFATAMCAHLLQNGTLWDMELVHGICVRSLICWGHIYRGSKSYWAGNMIVGSSYSFPHSISGKKDVTPVRQQWSYVFLALTHRYVDVDWCISGCV